MQGHSIHTNTSLEDDSGRLLRAQCARGIDDTAVEASPRPIITVGVAGIREETEAVRTMLGRSRLKPKKAEEETDFLAKQKMGNKTKKKKRQNDRNKFLARQVMVADAEKRVQRAGKTARGNAVQANTQIQEAEEKILRSCISDPKAGDDISLVKQNPTERYQRPSDEDVDIMQLVRDRATAVRGSLDTLEQTSTAPGQPRAPALDGSQETQPGAYAEGQRGDRVRRTDSLGNFSSEDFDSEIFSNSSYGSALQSDRSSIVEAEPVEDDVEHGVTAEPFDPEASQEWRSKERQKDQRKLLVGIMMCLIVGFVVLVVVGVVCGTSTLGDKVSDEMNHISDTTQNIFRTPAPAHPLADLLEALPDYTLESFQDPLSPQSKALSWLQEYQNITAMAIWRQKQLLALASFYYAADGPNWPFGIGKDWLDDTKSECDWFSVAFGNIGASGYEEKDGSVHICNQEGKLTVLNLSGIRGKAKGIVKFTIPNAKVPPEVALLTSLEALSVPNHDVPAASLKDLFPSQLVSLTKLRILNLGGSKLQGPIPPWLWRLTQLEELLLGRNSIDGSIPTQVGLMRSLEVLGLKKNSIVGAIPSELGLLDSLQEIHLGHTLLDSKIPSELGQLSRLTILNLPNTTLDGPLPRELFLLPLLESLDVGSSSLSGSIPSEIGQLSALQSLNLSHNSISGPLPPSLGLMTSLVELSLVNLSLTGTIPQEVGSLVNHSPRLLDLTNTSTLTGSIPEELCELSKDSCFYYQMESDSASSSDSLDEEGCLLAYECDAHLCGCGCACT